jgi:protein AATF/BFR2
MLGILNKWSSKIQVASMAVTSKAAGSSKFLQGTKGQTGVVDAIDAGLASKVRDITNLWRVF